MVLSACLYCSAGFPTPLFPQREWHDKIVWVDLVEWVHEKSTPGWHELTDGLALSCFCYTSISQAKQICAGALQVYMQYASVLTHVNGNGGKQLGKLFLLPGYTTFRCFNFRRSSKDIHEFKLFWTCYLLHICCCYKKVNNFCNLEWLTNAI